jgi:hypothetical protein
MNFRPIASLILTGAFLSAPAFAEIIDQSTFEVELDVSSGQIKCVQTHRRGSGYAEGEGEAQSRISFALDSGDWSSLPVLKHTSATVVRPNAACPTLREIVGVLSPELTTPVKITRTLQKLSLPAYGGCISRRLDEKIELKFRSGNTLSSRATHFLGTNCSEIE